MTQRFRSLRLSSAALGLVALVAVEGGCSHSYIPNTDVEETEENRQIVAFCEKYRRAVERKDANAIVKMVSPQYYEDGGNADATDDMDFERFKQWVTGQSAEQEGITFQDATSIRHEIRYRRVLKENNRIYVDYTFSASFRIPTNHGDEWKRKVDDNRLELVQDGAGGEYRIVAGM